MIKNERQYNLIRSRVERLRALEDELPASLEALDGPDRFKAHFETSAVRAELAQMRQDLRDYEDLRAGRADVGVPATLADLPRILIRARIAAGLSHAELAKRLGLKEQQVQRYEATNYESASLRRLREVAETLGVNMLQKPAKQPVDLRRQTVMAALKRIGLPKDLVEARFASEAESTSDERFAGAVLARTERIFGLPGERILAGKGTVDATPVALAAFKRSQTASEKRAVALSGYAYYLLQRVLEATPPPQHAVPTDALAFRNRIVSEHGEVNLRSVLHVLWDLGVPVLPLADAGGFDAAYWRRAGRGGIVLKQGRRFESLWLFDLLHEVGHAADAADVDELEVVENDPLRGSGEPELRANDYASQVVFDKRGERLVELVWEKAGAQPALVKQAVRYVARTEQLDRGTLAFHVAHRLAQRGIDWWGAAVNSQERRVEPWAVTRDVFVERLDWSAVHLADRELLTLALRDRSTKVPGEA